MKRATFFLSALVLLAASCTKTEVVNQDEQKRGIGFSAYASRTTKAAQVDVTASNLNSFKVTAIGNEGIYFNDETFSKNGGVWESTTPHFWPAYPLTFCAYNEPVPNNDVVTKDITVNGQTLTVTPSHSLADQEDLVAAYAKDKTESYTESGSLPLNFNHILTQVVVKAKNSSETYTVVVDEAKLANLAGRGTYTFSNNIMAADESLKNSASSTDYFTSSFGPKELNGGAQEVMTNGGNGKWYLIPQSVTAWKRGIDASDEMTNASYGTYLALKVIITKGSNKIYPVSGDQSGWMAVPVPTDLKFEQGKKYTVTIDFFGNNGAGYVDPEDPSDLDGDGDATSDKGKKIIGGVIKFRADVNNWGDSEITIKL